MLLFRPHWKRKQAALRLLERCEVIMSLIVNAIRDLYFHFDQVMVLHDLTAFFPEGWCEDKCENR